MKRFSSLIALALAAFLLWGCGNKNKRADGTLVTDKDPVKSYLSLIPADTPYAFVALEPMPIGPMLSWADSYGGALSNVLPAYSDILNDEYVDPSAKLLFAILAEFDAEYDGDRYKELGFSLSPRFALYGVGALPAVRFDLGDVEKFKAFIARIEERSGVQRVDAKLGDTPFWTYTFDDTIVVMSVQQSQFIIGFTPPDAADVFTPYLLGEQMPEKSMADTNTMQSLVGTHGFQKYGVGFLDIRRWAQMLLEPTPGLNDETLRAMGTRFPDVTEACRTETYALLDAAPRVVMGYENFTVEEARIGVGVELKNEIGSQLAASRTQTPIAGSDFARNAAVVAAFGFDVGKLIDIANERAIQVRNNPFQCEWFADLNYVATEVTTIAGGMPPFVRNLRGGVALVNDVQKVQQPAQPTTQPVQPGQPLQPSPRPQVKVHGLAMLASVDAVTLFNFIKSFVPQLLSFNPPTNGSPTALPVIEDLDFLASPHLALTTDSLMLTAGETNTNSASMLLQGQSTDYNPFAAIIYDFKAFANIAKEQGETLPEGFEALFGSRTTLELEPRDNGVFLHTAVKLPPAR